MYFYHYYKKNPQWPSLQHMHNDIFYQELFGFQQLYDAIDYKMQPNFGDVKK